MSEPIPTDPEAPDEEPIPVDPDFPPEEPVPPEPEPVEPGPELPVTGGWLDAAAQAEADANAYTDEQVPLIAGRMVPRNMDRAPTVEDGTNLIAGTGWNQYDPTTNDLVQMWRWDGAAWQALDMSAEMIPVLDIGSATVGDLTGDRINVTGTLSANIVDAMDVATKKLVVTEEAILNHATLIGDTVVDNINVTGKLIGTDGVFTGTVDFENVNVTGLQLVEKLEANSISADLIEGGHFTGETFEGGSFVGGEFRTSDQLPGQVTISDTAYINSWSGRSGPGIRVTPIDTTATVIPPGIGPEGGGIWVDGGKDTSGTASHISARPTGVTMTTEGTSGAGVVSASATASLMRTSGAGGGYGLVQATADSSLVRTHSGNGSESGWVRARPKDVELAYVDANNTYFSRILADEDSASLYTRAGGVTRRLTIDKDGVWVQTSRDGWMKSYNLEETAQDSGWVNLSYASGFGSAGSGGPFQIRRAGGIVHLRGRLARTSGTIVAGTEYTIGTLSSSWRPAYTQRTLIAGGSSSQWGRIEVSAITGEISVAAISGNMNWVDLTGTLWTVD